MNLENFVTNLSYMGKGMLGIFIVIGAIIVVTMLVNKIFSNEPGDDNK